MEARRSPIEKALKTLAYLIEADQLQVGVRELAKAIDVSPSRANKLLQELVDLGFVRQIPSSKKYALGVEFFRLSQLSFAKAPMREFCLVGMRHMVQRINETAYVAFFDQDRAEFVITASVESDHNFRFMVPMNTWLPLGPTAEGVCILAQFPAEQCADIVSRVSAVLQLDDVQVAAFWDAIRLAQQSDVAVSESPDGDGVRFAMPVMRSGRAIAAIIVIVPQMRFDQDKKQTIVTELAQCVHAVHQMLGSTDYY
jgi:IclR family acetate operon transcriptional repressor